MADKIEDMTPEELNKNAKQGCIIAVILLILAIIFIVNMCSDDEKSNIPAEIAAPIPSGPVVGSEAWKNAQIESLKSDSASIRNTDYLDDAKGSNLSMSVSIDGLKSKLIWDGYVKSQKQFYETDKRASIPLKYIRKRAKTILNNIMPTYRKAFAKNMAKAVWENDIYVTASGGQSTVLNITGGTFAANANISEFQNVINRDVANFGFKEVRYRWYKGADEYTTYKYE